MDDLNLSVCELNDDQLSAISGGYWMVIGAVLTTYKTAYETATWYGAGAFGSYIGSELYDWQYLD